MNNHRVFVLGGTGFVGRHLLNRLAREGIATRVATRHPHRCRDLRLVPGCEVHQVAGWDTPSLTAAMAGCTLVVNLVGILNEGGGRTFEGSHVTLVETATRAARAAGVPRFLHLSALNADAEEGPSDYLCSKGRGERVALAAEGLGVTCFRPSLIFGPGDHLFTRFAGLLRLAPGVLPLACADTRFAPVYVGDVIEAMLAALERPESRGQAYDLCGPRVFGLRELVEYAGERIGRRVRIVPLSDTLAQRQARLFQALPGKLFTLDNYRSLQLDSLCRQDGLGALGIQATDLEVVVPTYLGGASSPGWSGSRSSHSVSSAL